MRKKTTKTLITYLILMAVPGCGHRLTQEEQKKFENAYNNVQSGVSDWIKKYAMYPGSYQAISFGEFSQSVSKRHNKVIPNTERYIIKHTHNILDKDSNLTTFSGYFILEHDFDVNIIELERSKSMGGAFPPITQVWTDKFGRPLNAKDSLEFEKKQQQVNERFLKEMKDGLAKGDIYTEDANDMEKLKNLIDTLEKKN